VSSRCGANLFKGALEAGPVGGFATDESTIRSNTIRVSLTAGYCIRVTRRVKGQERGRGFIGVDRARNVGQIRRIEDG
jgi:hypothetical protein